MRCADPGVAQSLEGGAVVLLLVVVFVVMPIAELAVIVKCSSMFGVFNTIGVLILVSVVGAWLVKREGLSVLRRMAATVEAGGVPHKELVDGVLILLAGVLLVAPGFISDVVGILLLLPPIRAGLRAVVVRSVRKRGSMAFRIVDGMGRRVTVFGAGGPAGGPGGPGGSGSGGFGVYDVESRDAGHGRPRRELD